MLESLTTFVGGGGPRFWFSVSPELQQPNYAQLIVKVKDKDMTPRIVGQLQQALSERVPGARIDVRQLETKPVRYPVAIRIVAPAATAGDEAADTRVLAASPAGEGDPPDRRLTPTASATTGARKCWSTASRSIPIAPTSPGSPTWTWRRHRPRA